MGLILDTDVLIRAEKVTDPIDFGKWSHHGEAFISAITCSELLVGSILRIRKPAVSSELRS